MTTAPARPLQHRFRRLRSLFERRITLADNPSALVYGTLGVGLVIASEYAAVETYPKLVGASCVAMILYWLAHGYALLLGGRLARPAPLSRRRAIEAMRHEWSMFKGAALPILAILAAWIFGAPLETAATAGIWTAVAVVFICEVVAGLRAGLGRPRLLISALLGAVLGGALLLVKILLH